MQCSLYRGKNKKGGMDDWVKRERRGYGRSDLEREEKPRSEAKIKINS